MTDRKDSSDEDAIAFRKMITVRGLSGLRNIGNTCYMNAALQCLFSTNMLSAYFINKKFIKNLRANIMKKLANEERKKQKLSETVDVELDRSQVVRELKSSISYGFFKTVEKWLSDTIIIEPVTIKESLGKLSALFRGSAQQDSHEVLNCILDNIHEDLKTPAHVDFPNIPPNVINFRLSIKKYQTAMRLSKTDDEKAELIKNYRKFIDDNPEEDAIHASLEYWKKYIKPSHSVIRDLFTGMSFTETRCNQCHIRSPAFDPFVIFSLGIPKSYTSAKLTDCLREHTTRRCLIGIDKYQCAHCKDKTEAEQITYLWETADILIIHLKRFTNEMFGTFCRTEKNSTKIDFPLDDLDLSEYFSPYNKKEAKYELYGVVHQYGSLSGGHYISYCKNAINNHWYEFDDSHVSYIEKEKVESKIVSSNAYILFYTKKYTQIIDDTDEKESS
ncbi:MAG: ubiquitin carboxyl-terminal hydrolase [Harvfovirus sp.]|uniref:Ubiquitin carboxyl-terminal hydrolase n=1 Tax=Harvfovirus sp. TaxID=2487768 RepID=A0A3G5A206_9VIRU|nr:MAG: ubiquitin carboxyl-terminal hydrolase [Harvfovirus sp.]